MKDLIKDILKETVKPQWVKDWDALTKEQRIEKLEEKKKQIKKIIPIIVEFFESKFGDNLLKIEVSEMQVHMGNESYTMKKPLIEFFFKEATLKEKGEIFKDLKSFFNLDISLYVVPLEIKIYELYWKQV